MNDIRVEIDPGSGFCFGVVNAIRKAEEQLDNGGTLYCLGDIVHNNDEVERLRRKGLETISHQTLSRLRDARVLLRAHGEPPSTYETARNNNIEIVDATCPVVLMLQRRIKSAYDATAGLPPDRRPQIVIYGKRGHAEVNGLVGQTNGTATVVENTDGLDALDFTRDILLYSQTTKSHEGFSDLLDIIRRRMAPQCSVTAYDTICRQVSKRVDNIRAFAAANSVVLFVSGAKSSNGKVLFNECLSVNKNAHLICNADEIDPLWFADVAPGSSIGVCGATSTPRWLMEQVRDDVLNILKK